MLKMHYGWGLLFGWCVSGLLHAQNYPQNYPQKGVRLVIPFTAGGAADIIGRLLAAELSQNLGQAVVVDNRGGGGTVIGTEMVARASPDGYSLGLITPSFTINGAIRRLPFDSINDFAPIALVGITPLILVTHPSLPVHTVTDLIRLAGQHPGELVYASAGPGSPTHMGMELLRFSGIRMTHIPYKGAAPALVDLVGGHVQLMQTSIIIAKPYMSSMRLRPIAVTTALRAKNLPQVPSIAETIPGYEVLNWWGVVAPAKTPPAVVNRLNTEIRQVMNRASSKEKLSVEGAESANGSPVEFEQMLKKEISQWRRLGESIQLKLD